MTSMVDKLDSNGMLSDVRERMGAGDENDTIKDYLINQLDEKEAVAKWCGWNLGDESWGHSIIGMYESLKEDI